ncbi:MAG: N-acetylmuramoyl-L-alanine amidase [Pseudomonadota bacterium]
MIDMPSPNFDDRKGKAVSIILLHYTGMKTKEEALERLCDEESKVSAHYTIDEEGAVYHHVDEEKRAWHAGQSFWQGEEDINSLSMGIEVVNPGHEFGYQEFPAEQIKSLEKLCLDIQERHEIAFVLAHSDVAPDRKEDPGELFPWQELAKKGIGVWPSVSDEDFVKSAGIDVGLALKDLGYKASTQEVMIVAFQRHFVPEAFQPGEEGQACSLTKARLYALLAGHLISTE